jgi:hypothetical protein
MNYTDQSLNTGLMPEINIQLFKFKLFEKEIFAVLEKETQFEPFQKFMNRINKYENFDTCKLELFQELISKKYTNFNIHSIRDVNFVKNFLGHNFFDMFNKIEKEYKTIIRENKINKIIDK